MPVSFPDLLDAFEFGDDENSAVLCKKTGKIYWRFALSEEPSDELPDDIDDDETYIEVPNKRELGLGKPLVLAFVREFLPDDVDKVRYIFSKRGACGKFRTLLARRNAVDRWHNFESQATDRALREWCVLNSIEIVD
jgi:hypothetical protein